MGKYIVFSLLMSGALTLQAQLFSVDSLEQQLVRIEGPAKVQVLCELVWAYPYIDLPQAYAYARKARVLADSLRDPLSQAHSFWAQGTVNIWKANFLQALLSYDQALILYEGLQDTTGVARSYTSFAVAYQAIGDYPQALSYSLDALRLHRQLQDTMMIALDQNYAGGAHYGMGNYDLATRYNLLALDNYRHVGDQQGEASTFINLGDVAVSIDSLAQALQYYQRSYALAQRMHLDRIMILNTLYMSRVYFKRQEFATALSHQKQVLAALQQTGDTANIISTYVEMGYSYLNRRYLDSAEHTGLQAQRLVNRVDLGDLSEIYALLASIYEAQQNYQQAYQYQKQYAALQDSLLNEEKQQTVANLQARYEAQQQVDSLSQLEAQQRNLMAQTRRQRYRFYQAVIGLGLILLVAGGLLWRWRARRRKARPQRLPAENDPSLISLSDDEQSSTDRELLSQLLLAYQRRQTITKVLNEVGNSLTIDAEATRYTTPTFDTVLRQTEVVYPGFLTHLQGTGASLSDRELIMCILMKMRMLPKEIALFLNTSYDTVRTQQNRLKKKLPVPANTSLYDFL